MPIIKDTQSRLVLLENEVQVDISKFKFREEVVNPKESRVTYRVRLAFAPNSHPEIDKNIVDTLVKTTWVNCYWQKGLGGGKKGYSNEQISYENLLKTNPFPKEPANSKNTGLEKDINSFLLKQLLPIFGKERRFNLNTLLLSSFDVYKQPGFMRSPNIEIYEPVLKALTEEIYHNFSN